MSVYVSCSTNFMSLMLPFDYFLCGNNIYQVNNILESALPTKHHGVIFIRYIYKIIIILSSSAI